MYVQLSSRYSINILSPSPVRHLHLETFERRGPYVFKAVVPLHAYSYETQSAETVRFKPQI